MQQVWNAILSGLNKYGGLISFISLLLSIFIWWTTGNIRKTIIQKRQYQEYKLDKQAAVKHLGEINASIELDKLYDNGMKTELLKEINKLLKYKGFIDYHCRYYIFRINRILAASRLSEKNVNQVTAFVAKLCGRMSVDPVNKDI